MSGAVLVAASGRVPPLTATLTNTGMGGAGLVPGTIQTFSADTCNAVGGLLPYTYAWTYVSGDGSIYANTTTTATTRFSRYTTSPGTYTAVWKCVVTDGAATVVDSDTVTIEFEGFA